jgi:tetratricopeptide (TPR) repeat protein
MLSHLTSVFDTRTDIVKQDAEMRAVIRKGLQREAVGKQPVFLVRGRRVDLDFAFNYFKRKNIRNPAQIAQAPAPPTPEDVQSVSPLRFTPEESDEADLSTDSDQRQCEPETRPEIQQPAQVAQALAPPIPEDLQSNSPVQLTPEESDETILSTDSEQRPHQSDIIGRSTPPSFKSFQNWYSSLQRTFPWGNGEYVEMSFIPLAPTGGPSSPYEFRIVEDLIRSAHDFDTLPITDNPRERSDRFINLIWQTRSSLTRGQYASALRRHKQAADMVPDLVLNVRPSLLVDFVHSTISGASKLAIEFTIIPILTQIWEASIILHDSRHPVSRAVSTILAMFRLGFSPAFRAYLLVLHLKESLRSFQAHFGHLHENTLIVIFELHKALTDLGRYAEAGDYLEQLLSADEAIYGRKSYEACCDIVRLARCRSLLGEFDEGSRLLEDAWARASALYGDEFNRFRYDLLRESARSLKSQGKYEETMVKEKQRWNCAKADFGKDDWRTLDAEERLEELSAEMAIQEAIRAS